MGAMQSEIYEAFRDRRAAGGEALKAADVLGRRDEDFTEAVSDLKLDVAGVKGELLLHRWMLGFVLAANVAILFELFSH